MKLHLVLSAILLAFVAASIVTLSVKKVRQPSGGESSFPATGRAIAVCYFHGKARCVTCETIETFARDAIEDAFADKLASGAVVWRVVDYEQPGNEHFAGEFNLVAPSVVLVELRDGTPVRSKNLAKVWDLVGDKAGFTHYITGELRTFLAAGNTTPAGSAGR